MCSGELSGDHTLLVVFSDYAKKLYCMNIKSCDDVEQRFEISSKLIGRNARCRYWNLNGINMCYLMREMQLSVTFRKLMLAKALQCTVDMLWLQMIPPNRQIIDYKWNHMISYIVWEKVEVEYLMSWLSTLGGGFSALGEQFTKFAETAGKISLKQLHIGIRLGDPFLQARCKLYYSISLIQTGKLRAAKHIVREQYNFAVKHKEIDKRLINMCKGIWFRLQYEYSVRHEARLHERK